MKKFNSSWEWPLFNKKLYSPILMLLLFVGSSSSLLAQYCASNATSTFDSKLGEVTINGVTVPAVTTCATYTDNTALTPFSLNYGVPTASSFSYATCGGPYGSYAKVYIDFNQDQVFDASEVVREGNCSAGSPLVGTLSLPATGTIGLTRMRVVLRESGSSTSTVACGTYTYGETQDFTVNMRAAPSCLPPSQLSASISSPTSLDLNWSLTSGATGYEYSVVATGSPAPSAGTAATDTFATVSSLAIGSYDVYVRSVCSGTPSANWQMTTVLLDYCASFSTNSGDSKIGSVDIGGTTVVSDPTCATYTDLRGAASFSLQYAIPSSVTVAYGSCGSNYAAYAKVYIDFNNDLDFDDAGEMIAQGPAVAGTPMSSNLSMPASGVVGDFTMRVVLQEGGSSTATLACGAYAWGETQDYTVSIAAAPACAPPTGNAILSTYGYQATIVWSSIQTDFEIEWDTTGFVQGTATSTIVSVNNDTTYTFTGLSPQASYQYYIRSVCSGSPSIWAGPYSFSTTVSCPAPTNFGGSVGTTWAGISWQSNGLNTDYIYILDSAGVTTATGTIMNGVGDSLYVGGLYPNTAYTLYVANNCGADTSNWSGAVNFTTQCDIYTAPYFQNFNSIASGFTGTLDCWNLGSGATVPSVQWQSRSGSTPSTSTGPSSGNGGSGVYIYLETSSAGDDIAYAVSPLINIDGLSNPEAAFVYHMYGADMGTLRVDVWNGSSWDLGVWSISGQQHASTTAAWTPAAISLVGYSGDIALRFAGNRNGGFNGDMAIDDFSIASPSPCAVPSNLGSWVNSESSATIYWTAGDALATSWVVQYGPAGNANNSMLVSNDTVTLTGLGHSTLHDFLVGEICANGDTSWIVGPAQFQTWFAPNYLEDFDLGYSWSEGKGRITDSTTFTGASSNWGNGAFNNDFVTNDLAASMNIFSTGRYEWMFSPTIVVPDNGTVYELSFDMGMTEWNSSLEAIMGVDDTVMVVVSTDNGVTWSNANVVYTIHQGNKPAGVLSWPVSIPLFGYSGNLKIGFYAEGTVSNGDIDVFIDNVAITENCSLAPMSISGVNFVSSPAQYNVQYSVSGGDLFVLQTREAGTDTWFTPKSWTNASATNQNFLAKRPGVDNEVRLGARVDGNFYYSCPMTFSADCKPMTVNAIELVAPFCAGDSAVLKAIDAGGFKAKTYLWNTGETTRFIYGQQGQTYQVVVTDAAGCSDSASVTVSNVGSPYTPGNFALAKPNQVTFVGSWTAPSLGSGVSLIGYRMQYRQVNVGAPWRQTGLITSATSATIDFTGSCDVAANYEFAVFARVNDNGMIYNTPVTCTERRFYNGSGGCTAAKSDINSVNASLNGITVYPNPTNSMLNVGINGETSTLQLLDMNGKVLFNQEFVGQAEANINMSEFASGVYMLNITNATGVYQERVIKN